MGSLYVCGISMNNYRIMNVNHFLFYIDFIPYFLSFMVHLRSESDGSLWLWEMVRISHDADISVPAEDSSITAAFQNKLFLSRDQNVWWSGLFRTPEEYEWSK